MTKQLNSELLFSMRRKLNRMVARVMGQPPSTYAALLSIPEELSVTIRGSVFLLVFSSHVSEDEGTIIVFATKADLLKFDPSDGVFVVENSKLTGIHRLIQRHPGYCIRANVMT